MKDAREKLGMSVRVVIVGHRQCDARVIYESEEDLGFGVANGWS